MATITPPRTNEALVELKLIVLEPRASSQLQSPEGRKIAQLADEILQNVTTIKEHIQFIRNTDETDYNPVPPKRSERVIMRSQFKGRKKPLPYIFDEE